MAAPPQSIGFILRFLAFLGWMSLCTGIAFVIIVANTGSSDLEIPAAMLSLIGFGLVTFPFVIRELEGGRRQQAQQAQQTQQGRRT